MTRRGVGREPWQPCGWRRTGGANPGHADQAGAMARHRVVVYPPTKAGGCRLRVDGCILGTAYSLHDLSVFLCHAGIMGLTEVDLAAEDPIKYVSELIEWRGGSPGTWETVKA